MKITFESNTIKVQLSSHKEEGRLEFRFCFVVFFSFLCCSPNLPAIVRIGQSASLLKMCLLKVACTWLFSFFFRKKKKKKKKKKKVEDKEGGMFVYVSFKTLIRFQGLTAATGHLADNHDVHGITVRNLDQDAKFADSETVREKKGEESPFYCSYLP